MTNFIWKGWKWFAYDHCKNTSSADKHSYYAENVTKTEHDELFFYIKYAPKKFDNDELNTQREFGCAHIQSEHVFSYGKFIFDAKLSNSPKTWEAIWLYGVESWPPEVDIVESFPNKNGSVLGCPDVKWETNIHYQEPACSITKGTFVQVDTKDTNVKLNTNIQYKEPIKCSITGGAPMQLGAKGINLAWYLLTHRFNKPDRWVLDWTPNYIKIYFNGLCIRKVTDPAVLATFNKDPRMRVVVNTMTQEGFGQEEYTKQQGMYLTNFDYIPYQQ